ncbi:MAG TPA: TolC family protein [Burkholderiales bacterium]|nr:TolC family protein [Burkholderiales bacterium]
MRYLEGGCAVALCCLAAAFSVASSQARAQQYWLQDPLGVMRTSPSPEKSWQPDRELPTVPFPEISDRPDPERALSLPELTEFALRNNPRTRQSWFSARATAAALGVTRGDDLPDITGGYAFNRSRPVSATSGVASPWLNRYGPSISFSYVLFDFGAKDDRREAAEYRLLNANLAHNRTLQDLIFQVEQAYYQLIGVEALVRVNEQALKNIQTALDAVRRRREGGLATVADVYRTETQVAQAQLALTRSRGDLEKARGQLATVVGLPVNSSLRIQTLSAPPGTSEVVTSISAYLEQMKTSRPDLLAAEAQVRSARATIAATSKAGLPSIEVSAASTYNDYRPDRPNTIANSLIFNVRIPIFTGFKDTYSNRQAEALAAQAEAARDALYQQSTLEVWQSYYDLQTVRSSISSTETQVKSAEQTAEATLARYKSGFGTILDLITAQQDETNARTQRIQAYLDWYTVLARLNLALGASDNSTTTVKTR